MIQPKERKEVEKKKAARSTGDKDFQSDSFT